jgi:hypothetical protein
MLVHPESQQSDPRVMCGIMARAALERFNGVAEEQKVRDAYFFNLMRVLEMYRYDAFENHNVGGILERNEEIIIKKDDNMLNAVVDALSSAHNSIYPQLNKEDFVEHFRSLLDQIRQKGIEEIDANELQNMRQFLQTFEEKLAE